MTGIAIASKSLMFKVLGSVVAVLVLTSCFLGAGWYVSNQKYEGQVHRANGIQAQLEVSNASYKSIRDEFMTLSKTLEENQEKALESHAVLQTNLKTIIENDKSMAATEKYLLSRTPTTDCKTPKELADVWSKM